MKALIDTNVILDNLLDRKPLVDASSEVLSLCASKEIEGYISATSISDINYIVKKAYKNSAIAYYAIKEIARILSVLSVTSSDVNNAIAIGKGDFEDNVQIQCAMANSCDVIITRNLKHFKGSSISVLSPESFLSRRLN